MLLKESIIAGSAQRMRRYQVERTRTRLKEGARRTWITMGEQDRRRSLVAAMTGNPRYAAKALERIIDGNDLVGINYLTLGLAAARSVGRIHIRDDSGRTLGYGTGFLVAPGVLMTNEHVIGSDVEAAHCIVEFDYEQDERWRDRQTTTFALAPEACFITNAPLDFTLIGVAPKSETGAAAVTDFGWLPLNGIPGKAFEGEYLTIIQHPGGERKQICVRENRLIKYADDTVWYQTDTVAGSSGSPVFNNFWQVVALHHSGVPKKNARGDWLTIDGKVWDPSMDETKIKWMANEGIRVSRIVEHLQQHEAVNTGAKAVLRAGKPLQPENRSAPLRNGISGAPAVELKDGTLSLVLPVRITLPLGAALGAELGLPGVARTALSGEPAADPGGATSGGLLVEKVTVDQTSYANRKGYSADFLGKNALSVPLPTLSSTLRKLALTFEDTKGAKLGPKITRANAKTPFVLDYHNYSVVMHRLRRLAIVAAVNIDGRSRRSTGKREGDKWFEDPRILKKHIVHQEFYDGLILSEARKTPFDRGHLVRRLDSTWGASEAEAKVHGDDTFHFTNCAPQHMKFNQGKTLWAGLEDYVLAKAENQQRRITVMNGPIFDYKKKPDGTLRKVKLPRAYWKLAIYERDGKLRAAAFKLEQIEQLATVKGIELSPLDETEARAFQISMDELEGHTGLDFGARVRAADTLGRAKAIERTAAPGGLSALSQIRL